jgi:hypothetical protein
MNTSKTRLVIVNALVVLAVLTGAFAIIEKNKSPIPAPTATEQQMFTH